MARRADPARAGGNLAEPVGGASAGLGAASLRRGAQTEPRGPHEVGRQPPQRESVADEPESEPRGPAPDAPGESAPKRAPQDEPEHRGGDQRRSPLTRQLLGPQGYQQPGQV